MKVENKVMPNEKQMEEFLEEGNDEPIFMVNLLKFKEKAEYPDKREFSFIRIFCLLFEFQKVHHKDRLIITFL